jgi:DNA-binding CsgD family transcriptional regulator/tetratricopeptide (TPR) repeat protein
MGRSVRALGSTVLERWPLIGRSDEVAFAREVIADGGSVVIAGDAGVGKTRLAREVIASVDADGRQTEWAVATHAGREIPLGAVAHLVSPEALGGGREATLRAVVEALDRHRQGRIVLGVDDAHLLDRASALLVHQLVTAGIASAVITVRAGEQVPDPVISLWKNDVAVRVELQPLSWAEVAELLAAALGGAVDPSAVHALGEWTAGNVLFLRELVVQGLEGGSLRSDDQLWHWVGPLELGERLHDVVTARLGSLDAAERHALEVVAAGEPVPMACADKLFDRDVIARLERRGLVRSRVEAGGVNVRPAHPLFGELVRVEAPAWRFDDVRRRLADALQDHEGSAGKNALRIATWRAEAGDQSDPQVLIEGARRAWAVGEVELAERLARLALDPGPDFEASYLLGEALADQGRFEEAVEVWRAVEDLPASDNQRATFAASLAGILLYALGRQPEADAAIQRAEERVTDPAAQQELSVVRTFINVAWSTDTSSRGIERVMAALRSPALPEWARARVALGAVTAWTEAGRLEQAIEGADDAIAITDRHAGELVATGQVLRLLKSRALWLAGDLDEAGALATASYASALDHDDDRSRARWAIASGVIDLLRGDARAAAVRLGEGEVVLRGQDDGFLRGVLVYSSMAAALLRDVPGAERALQDAQVSNPSMARSWDVDLARARAWVCMARGERSAAVGHLHEAAACADGREQWSFESLALYDLARFGEARAAAGRLHELAAIIDGKLVAAFAAHAHGLARSDADALDGAARTLADLGLQLHAAEAAAAASMTHRSHGRRASAAASANRARAWLGACAGVHTPALRWADEDDELTVREREVATLAARGLTNQQIADRLFVSLRTVHAHLRSAYAKLGISGRGELGSVLGT